MAWTNPVIVAHNAARPTSIVSGIRHLLILAIMSGVADAIGTAAISAHRATIVKAGSSASSSSSIPSSSDRDENNNDPDSSSTVERYYFEHMIGEKEAAAAFDSMAETLIEKPTPAWCKTCTKSIVRYCLDRRMLHDHCCCDSGHERDQLPWLPHSCYVGDNCTPNMKSCMQYTEIRECCCDHIMAKQWRDIRSSAHRWTATVSMPMLLRLLLLPMTMLIMV